MAQHGSLILMSFAELPSRSGLGAEHSITPADDPFCRKEVPHPGSGMAGLRAGCQPGPGCSGQLGCLTGLCCPGSGHQPVGRLDNIPQGWGGAAGVTYMGGGTTQLEKAVPWTWECQLKNQLWEQGGGAWRCWLPWTSVEEEQDALHAPLPQGSGHPPRPSQPRTSSLEGALEGWTDMGTCVHGLIPQMLLRTDLGWSQQWDTATDQKALASCSP